MKKDLNSNKETENGSIVWTCVKLLLIIYWLTRVVLIYFHYNHTPLPHGIFSFFSFNYSQFPLVKYLFVTLAIGLSIMYLFEINMKVTTFFIFILSVFSFSFEESNGVLNIYSLLSFLFFAQFAAYALPLLNKRLISENYRMTFSIQAICAAYTLSALSKISVSGISWIHSGKFMALQILKSFHYKYVTNGDWSAMQKGQEMADFLDRNPVLITILLTITLALELFSLLAVISAKLRFWYGLALLSMHIAILVIMNINLFSISFPMTLFFVFPPIINCFTVIFRKPLQI